MVKRFCIPVLLCFLCFATNVFSNHPESLTKLIKTPQSLDEVWGNYDPEKEPMLVETFKEWEEEGIVIQAIRYYIGTFKGKKAWMAGLYAFPKGGKNLPAILQSHGGGGRASLSACLNFAKRGYAIFSLSWRVDSRYLKDHDLPPDAQTDWGGVTGDQISDARGIEPTNPRKLDSFISGRNEGYFLRTLAARRGITFLAKQSEVNPEAIGMTGHSMGGVITHQTTAMEPIRIKASAPSDGPPIKHIHPDPHNPNPDKEKKKLLDLELKTASPASYASKIKVPMLFLNSINDFHGHCEDVEWIIDHMPAKDYCIARTVHANHSHNASVEASTFLWFDAHLKGEFVYPKRPEIDVEFTSEMIAIIKPDLSTKLEIESVDVYYTRDGENNFYRGYQSRIWKFAKGEKQGQEYRANIPVIDEKAPLWVYVDIQYKLPKAYEAYKLPDETKTMSSSSRMLMFNYHELKESGIAMLPFKSSTLVSSFGSNWEKEWMSRRLNEYISYKLLDRELKIPEYANLVFELESDKDDWLTFSIGDYRAKYKIKTGENKLEMYPFDFKHGKTKESFLNWKAILKDRPHLSFRSNLSGVKPLKLNFAALSEVEFNKKRPFRLVKENTSKKELDLSMDLADEIIRKHGDFHKSHIPVFTSTKGKETPDYDKGLMVGSGSEITFNLNQVYQKFKTICGVHHSGSITYEVWADGDKLYDSGKITSKSKATEIEVDVRDKTNLKLIVTDAGNGHHGDVAMWANPRLE